MAMEDVEKDDILLISNKRELYVWGYTFHFHGSIEVKTTNYYYQLLGIILHLQNKK